MHPRWAEGVPDAATWRPPQGRSLQEATREQDEAAGGRSRRVVELDGGAPATASVELKLLPKSRRVYAYLRYARDGRTANVYIGQVDGESRLERLRGAWQQVHDRGLLRADTTARR
jgi:DNA mismatch endonuclease (patch repair protein)